jgi:hypothetical protein
MKIYNEESSSSSATPQYIYKKCEEPCVVRVSKSKEHKGCKFYACSCIDDSFIWILCDEVQFNMNAQQ